MLLLLAAIILQPAIAEIPDNRRVVELTHIEVNTCYRDGCDPLRQIVFWRVWRDKAAKEVHVTDCGWVQQSEALILETDDGFEVWARDVRYVAPDLYFSTTDYDPEMVYRTGSSWGW